MLVDGDIPCTPEVEPSYSFVWNFCAKVTSTSIPKVCSSIHQAAAALQYLDRKDGYSECNVIGNYDENRDDTHYKLIDTNNPAKGVSVTYPLGDKCPSGALRSATIDVLCDNVHATVVSALEPAYCEYHMEMKSYYGCPKECPVTKHGLCSSHGHCAYDYVSKAAYCFCNDGYHGADCSIKGAASTSTSIYDGHSVQVGLLVVLLIITLALLGGVGFMVYRLKMDREQQQSLLYHSRSSSHGLELSSHDMYN